MNTDLIIDVQSISFHYPTASHKTLDSCSLTIHRGELISILGPNGAGKSTFLNCVCGLLTPQSGAVYLNGISIGKMGQRSIAKVIGYVQQYQSSAFAYSVFDYVLMGRASNVGLFHKPTSLDRDCVQNVLENMGIAHLANSSVMEISGGERQQAAIARAIVQQPEVVFFDEPTAHLDYGNQIKTLNHIDQLRQEGYAVVMTTHTPDHCVMLGGKVAVLNREGHLCCGNADEMITEDRLRKLYHTDLRVIYIDQVSRYVCVPNGLSGREEKVNHA